MKLKKIASLALAGVMAVSMLAGCANKPGNNNDGNGNGQVETTVADVLNKAQTGDVKVNFTENADLNAALQTAIAEYGIKVNADNLTKAAGLVGIDETVPTKLSGSGCQFTTAGSNPDLAGLLTNKVEYATYDDLAGTYTTVGYKEFKGYPSTASAVTAMANEMNEILGNDLLDTNSDTTSLVKGGKYYTYSYDGNVALVILNQPNGTVNYGLFYVINQTVAVATYNG